MNWKKGDRIAIKGKSRIFTLTNLNGKLYLSTNKGTSLSGRLIESINGEITDGQMQDLVGINDFWKVGMPPTAYGIIPKYKRKSLDEGEFFIEKYTLDGWVKKGNDEMFEMTTTYRALKRRCTLCGNHMA